MKAPASDPGDFCIALRAESTLFMPAIAKSADAPKRFQHVSPFTLFYHRHVVSKRTFGRVDHTIFSSLWQWARRSPNRESSG